MHRYKSVLKRGLVPVCLKGKRKKAKRYGGRVPFGGLLSLLNGGQLHCGTVSMFDTIVTQKGNMPRYASNRWGQRKTLDILHPQLDTKEVEERAVQCCLLVSWPCLKLHIVFVGTCANPTTPARQIMWALRHLAVH